MGTLLDYLKEYGDYTLAEKPFCEVDSLILSQFSYLKFDGMLPEEAALLILLHGNLDLDPGIRIQMLTLVFAHRIIAARLYLFFYHIVLFHLVLKSHF